ncbi:complement component 1 Q subcomponent-binding protein, mitochondrial [Lathamus discolor]
MYSSEALAIHSPISSCSQERSLNIIPTSLTLSLLLHPCPSLPWASPDAPGAIPAPASSSNLGFPSAGAGTRTGDLPTAAGAAGLAVRGWGGRPEAGLCVPGPAVSSARPASPHRTAPHRTMLLTRALRAAAALRPPPRRLLPLSSSSSSSSISFSSASPRSLPPPPGSAPPLARSLWPLGPALLRPRRGSAGGVPCGCGGLHTEGDKAFAQFLSDEIKEERKIQKHKALPKVSGGWELEVHGTEARLVRKVAGEKITVTFNINNSIPPSADDEPQEGQKADEQEPDLTSTPNFVVEVIKDDTKQTLVLDCHYPEDEIGNEGEEESDIFTIREVSFQPTGESDWKDTNYTLNTDSLDWALYDHLMDFLADRGVDNTFADELIELSTALEHQEYIKFLEDLKSFVKCQ